MEPEDIKNLSLYCFSALIQADAAVFGLLAVFIVYQIQALGNNQMNSYNLISSQGTTARPDFEHLLLPIALETKHWILMRHSSSAYYSRLMATAAFTEHWKSNVIKVSKSMFILLVLHAAISSFGLFYAIELNPVWGITPLGRIVVGLVTFVLLLTVISCLGYSFLSKNSYGEVPETPLMDLTTITIEEVKSHSSKNDQYGNLFRVAGHDKTRFISLTRGQRNTVSVNCLRRLDDGRYSSMRSQGDMDDANLQSFVRGMKTDPEHYWSNK